MEGLQNHDTECAKELSGELSQIRKMIKIISSARLSLEQIKLRLETVTDLGDVAWGATPSDVRRKWNTKRISSMILEADQLFKYEKSHRYSMLSNFCDFFLISFFILDIVG